MLHVGADASKLKAALPDITKSLLQILASPAGDDVKRAAISALSSAFEVHNVSVTGCTFQGTTK